MGSHNDVGLIYDDVSVPMKALFILLPEILVSPSQMT